MEKVDQMLIQLKADLNSGKYQGNRRFPSEYELAERFGVNKKTANKAVSLLVADGWLYRGKRGQGTMVSPVKPFPGGYLLCISQVENQYQAKFLKGVQAAAFQNDYLLSYTNPPPEKLNSLLDRLNNSPVRGIVTGYYGKLKTSLPTVYIDRIESANDVPFYSVSCNNYQGGYDIMKLLISRGHKNIVIFNMHDLMPERLFGFQDAMKEAGFQDISKRVFKWQDISNYEAEKQTRSVFRKFPETTAIACASDDLMLHAIAAMDHQGIDWKYKIAITGFGNLLGTNTLLPVASVDQHPYNLGFTAVENLIALIEKRGEEVPLKSVLDAEIINAGNIPLLQ